MKRLKWKDIPIGVLESVYNKWMKVKINMPSRYWARCALCEYCIYRCDVCPAVPKKWCVRGRDNCSRLSEVYHWCGMSDVDEMAQKWKKEITKFLKFLRRHIKNRRKK